MTASIIAIDGPAASGKSTIGGLLAKRLGYLFFDSGILYRVVTLLALEQGIPVREEGAVTRLAQMVQIDMLAPTVTDGRQYTVLANGRDITWQIREPRVDSHVSAVSAFPGVRQAMLELQRKIGRRGRVVMVGRDIGSVVLPEADCKIYLDASREERAQRRFDELQARGRSVSLQQVLADLVNRDEVDSGREFAPLRQTEDAIYLDSTGLEIPAVLARSLELARSVNPGG